MSDPANDAIVPDDKDWTWVIERPCPECGFDPVSFGRTEIGALLRANAAAWPAVLARPDAGARPFPSVWSPLEYGCHVRDTLALFRERLALLLSADDPQFANWDQDATAVERDYRAQDPADVARAVLAEAAALAADWDALPADDAVWARPGRRSNGSVFTVETLGRYLVHDPVHHLADVG